MLKLSLRKVSRNSLPCCRLKELKSGVAAQLIFLVFSYFEIPPAPPLCRPLPPPLLLLPKWSPPPQPSAMGLPHPSVSIDASACAPPSVQSYRCGCCQACHTVVPNSQGMVGADPRRHRSGRCPWRWGGGISCHVALSWIFPSDDGFEATLESDVFKSVRMS